jgi:hypothetical protein
LQIPKETFRLASSIIVWLFRTVVSLPGWCVAKKLPVVMTNENVQLLINRKKYEGAALLPKK